MRKIAATFLMLTVLLSACTVGALIRVGDDIFALKRQYEPSFEALGVLAFPTDGSCFVVFTEGRRSKPCWSFCRRESACARRG